MTSWRGNGPASPILFTGRVKIRQRLASRFTAAYNRAMSSPNSASSAVVSRLRAQVSNAGERLTPEEGLATALDLFDSAIEMLHARLRRQLPALSEEEIEARIDSWLHDRPGAENCPQKQTAITK